MPETPTGGAGRVDGQTWVRACSTGATLRNLKVGPFAYNGAATTTSLHVAFDFVHLSALPSAPGG